MSAIPKEILNHTKFIPRDRDMKSRTADIMKDVFHECNYMYWDACKKDEFCWHFFLCMNKTTGISNNELKYNYPFKERSDDSDSDNDSEF